MPGDSDYTFALSMAASGLAASASSLASTGTPRSISRRAVELEHEHGTRVARPAHARARMRDRPTHALDIHVVLLRPERGCDLVDDIATGGIAAGDRPVPWAWRQF